MQHNKHNKHNKHKPDRDGTHRRRHSGGAGRHLNVAAMKPTAVTMRLSERNDEINAPVSETTYTVPDRPTAKGRRRDARVRRQQRTKDVP
jgi:hypothetical protein